MSILKGFIHTFYKGKNDQKLECVWFNVHFVFALRTCLTENRFTVSSDQTLVLNTPASSSMFNLQDFGYETGTSGSVRFHLKTCDKVTIQLLKTGSVMLYDVEIRQNDGSLSDNQGSSDTITGITQNCAEYRQFSLAWEGSNFVLEHVYNTNILTASTAKQNVDAISLFSFKSDSSTFWIWELNATGEFTTGNQF